MTAPQRGPKEVHIQKLRDLKHTYIFSMRERFMLERKVMDDEGVSEVAAAEILQYKAPPEWGVYHEGGGKHRGYARGRVTTSGHTRYGALIEAWKCFEREQRDQGNTKYGALIEAWNCFGRDQCDQRNAAAD